MNASIHRLGLPSPAPETPAQDRARPDVAQALLKELRRRASFMPHLPLRDDPWVMLLDLYIRQCQGRPTSVSDACIGTRTPQTTALRWLGRLESCGVLHREADRTDRRRILVALSAETMHCLSAYLNEVDKTRTP